MQADSEFLWQILGALMAGTLTGAAFGELQVVGCRPARTVSKPRSFRGFWALGSSFLGRALFLFLALALVKLLCPLLFATNREEWVSVGVLAGYGWAIHGQLRKRQDSEHLNEVPAQETEAAGELSVRPGVQ